MALTTRNKTIQLTTINHSNNNQITFKHTFNQHQQEPNHSLIHSHVADRCSGILLHCWYHRVSCCCLPLMLLRYLKSLVNVCKNQCIVSWPELWLERRCCWWAQFKAESCPLRVKSWQPRAESLITDASSARSVSHQAPRGMDIKWRTAQHSDVNMSWNHNKH